MALAAAAVSLATLGSGEIRAAEIVNTGYFDNIAILGYDPVAYFTDGYATKGSPEFTKKWLGATWYFASAEHRDAFASEPIRYAPQYNGFCALGTAIEEASANIDPEAWRIIDGKLYLFSGGEGLEEDFDAAPATVTAKADAKWPGVAANESETRTEHN
ncbi:YHS domain-containing (seleno)protein [Rhizobium sp. 007]|uniref:YHS domain-containing (seleno)protein n=1 Tax=Rhizobium sp. 007 TaxID=2785056 RepID=UPI0032B12290